MSEEQKKESENGFEKLEELFSKLAKEIKNNPIKTGDELEFPMEITGIRKVPLKNINSKKTGSLVKIRPCSKKYKEKTYLGIYLGDIPIEIIIGLYEKTNILRVDNMSNPAIFVPELNKVIFGYESWWGVIKSEEDLKEITDNDIENVWYVKALKQQLKEEKN